MAPFTDQDVLSCSLPGTYSHLKMARRVTGAKRQTLVWEEAGSALRLAGASAVFGFGPDLNGGFSAATPGCLRWGLTRRPCTASHASTQAPLPSGWRRRRTIIPGNSNRPPIIDDDLIPAVCGHYRHRKWPPKSSNTVRAEKDEL